MNTKQTVSDPFSGSGPLAHFYGANGFPTGIYAPFLSHLRRQLTLGALHMRDTWPGSHPPRFARTWELHADDLITHLDQTAPGPVVGIGHSMGACSTAIAAVRRPDLFTALVLIEPALVTPPPLTHFLPMVLAQRFEPIYSTLRKPAHWPDAATFRAWVETARPYRRFAPEIITAMEQHMIRPAPNGGVELAFPPAWEAWNYLHASSVLPYLKRLTLPTLAIRAKPSRFSSADMWHEWAQAQPNLTIIDMPDHGHLTPMEAPIQTGQTILDHLNI